jgi:hypothetical protein
MDAARNDSDARKADQAERGTGYISDFAKVGANPGAPPPNHPCGTRIIAESKILFRITLAESVCAAKYTFPGIFGGSATARLFGYGRSDAMRFQERQG